MTKNGFHPLDVRASQKSFGYIPVVDNLAARFEMPVCVVNGVSKGPTLAVTGGLYPTEYCGVEAAARLYQRTKPEKLSGMLIVIPVVNMPVFRFRTPWFNLRSSISPMDGGNINRLFPGDPNGGVTSVLAHTLFGILSKADYHVDFRGGDLPESHLSHTIYLKMGKKIDETCETMAKIFGLEYVLPGTPEIGHTSEGTLIYELVSRGIPSIISESGLGYRTQPLEVLIMNHVEGAMNLLKYFGMLEGEIIKPKKQHYLDMEWHLVSAPVAGIFHAISDEGDIVNKGATIGKITDIDGSELFEVTSPITGIIHTMYIRRVVYPGDRLYTLLKVGRATGWNK